MKETFEEFYKVLLMDRKNSDYSKKRTVEVVRQQILDEAEELREALESGDSNAIKSEVGDVLWDTLMLIIMLEEKHDFTCKDVIQESLDKIRRRKAHIFDPNNFVDEKEEYRRWEAVKATEK